ncbi:MAG: PKD domain-containing protein [Candidatus Methylomirabilales bacterium]
MRPRRYWRRKLWVLIGVGLLVGLDPVAATAGSVSLMWDPNTEGDLGGYKVHVGTASRTYSQDIDVGHVTSFTVSNLADGQTYFFAVTAYDVMANESGFSSEVSTMISSTVNSPPRASFSYDCADLVCSFTDTSTDTDGTLVAWHWSFGEGSSATGQSISHTYAEAGTYAVTLTVTDENGATDSSAQSLAIASSSAGTITLTALGYKVKGLLKASLSWEGATSSNMDIYRNGIKIANSAQGGSYTDHINERGKRTYTYQVCGEGAGTCSNEVTVTRFK